MKSNVNFHAVLRSAVLLFAVACSSAMALSKPVVLASIKPVGMLVKAVVGDEFSVEVLLPANVSPHDYALKFSDIRAIRVAELVVWVGPELEGMLTKPLKPLADKQLQLTALNTLQWPDENDHHHGEHSKDPHIWINPKNGSAVVMAVAKILGDKYPEKRPLFNKNAGEIIEKINELDGLNQLRLGALQEIGFVVTHDGYGHFVDYYRLHQLDTIQLAGGLTRGVRHYSEMIAVGDKVACVYSEPQLNSKAATQLAGQLGSGLAELDPMGSDIELSKDSYLEFFREFTETFASCLERDKP